MQKYTLNNDYFDSIDNETKAYFLGFLYADGCNHKQNNAFNLQLKESDKYILDIFKKDLEYTGPLLKVQKKNIHYNLNVFSKKICQTLEKLGVVANKTFLLNNIPDINSELLHHFIRGVFDGDGCIRYVDMSNFKRSSKLRFCICGNEPFLENIQNVLINNLGISKNKLNKFQHSKSKQLEYTGNTNCKKIYNYLYKDATIFLTRKKEIFDTYVQ